ncbi:MAG: hypothetical protein HC794_03075 [Nitrospiraceae bacterium]|nr:hypothetical protein [Nitrospiraceae bacterium]
MKAPTYNLEDTILDVLQRTGPCSLDGIVQQLLLHDWSEVFAAVDRMSRDGRIVLRRDPESIGIPSGSSVIASRAAHTHHVPTGAVLCRMRVPLR